MSSQPTVYLTMQEAAERLPGKLKPETVRDRCVRGDLRGIFDGDRWYTTQEAVDEFLQRKTQERMKVPQPYYPAVHTTGESLIEKYRRKPKSRRPSVSVWPQSGD